jgi:large subunit ribosomal protein L10
VPTQAKVESVKALKDRLGAVQAAVLTEYRGLTVRQLSDLRRQLKAASAEYAVVKNRLARLAVQGSAFDALGPHLKGPTGLVLTRRDPVVVAKALAAFVRTSPAFAIKVGFVEGKVLGPGELRALADLPSRDALRAQVVGAVQGPLARLATLLTAPQGELVRVLEARGKQAAE